MLTKLRRYFITGLIITLPVFITTYFLFLTFRFIDGVCGGVINYFLRKELGFSIPGIGIMLGILTVLVVGFLATRFLGNRLFPTMEKWFLKFPLIRQIYPPAKQIVNFFISKDKPAFKKVVLVEYPSRGIWSVGFVTNEGFKEAREKVNKELIHVFIASTPSPLTGFFVLVPKGDVKFLNISVEDGIKLIVSGGILMPETGKNV